MELDQTQRKKLVGGMLVGAILGLGAAWLLIKAPTGLAEGEEPEPITSLEILGLAGLAASLIRKLDDFRRKM